MLPRVNTTAPGSFCANVAANVHQECLYTILTAILTGGIGYSLAGASSSDAAPVVLVCRRRVTNSFAGGSAWRERRFTCEYFEQGSAPKIFSCAIANNANILFKLRRGQFHAL